MGAWLPGATGNGLFVLRGRAVQRPATLRLDDEQLPYSKLALPSALQFVVSVHPWSSGFFPIFNSQSHHTVEFTCVVGNQCGIVGAGDGSDKGFVRAEGFALGQQIGVDLPVVFGAFIIKGQTLQWGKKGFEQLQIGFHALATSRTT